MASGGFVKDYPGLFDPEVYLKTYYVGMSSQEDLMPFLYLSLHKSFSEGDLRGDRLLDIGTGPSVCSIISAAPRFKDIYLSDVSENNRKFLRKWLDGSADHSFQTFYEYFLKLEGQTCHWSEREREIRSKVKDILPCDLLQDSILQEDIGQFDAITSSLCLEAAATDLTCYGEICKKITSLLKPGGHLVLVGVLEQTFYVVGEHRFYTLYMTKGDLIKAWKSAGFDVVNCEVKQAPPAEENPFSDYGAGFVLFAQKS